jgi:hypothetical protein
MLQVPGDVLERQRILRKQRLHGLEIGGSGAL